MDRVTFGRGTAFTNVTLEDALLVTCVLDGVTLKGCTLPDSLLIRTSLADTKFERGKLADDEFANAMSGAQLRDCIRAAQFARLPGVRENVDIQTSTPLPVDARQRLAALAEAGDARARDVF